MSWSEEVHARRLLDIRERRKKEKRAGIYAVPQVKDNAGSIPMAISIGELIYAPLPRPALCLRCICSSTFQAQRVNLGRVKYLKECGSGLDRAISNTDTLSSVVAWKKEGQYLRGRDARRIPYVGNWLAEHVPRW